MTTDTKKFTLINYRPNGSEYLGCSEYENYNSEIGFEKNLDFEQLRRRIIDHTKRHRFEEDSDCEFVVLMDGKPIACRGESLWSFEEAIEPTEESEAINELLSEALVLSQKEKADKAQAKRDAEAERQRKAVEEQERKRYADAKRFIADYESKQTGGTR
jgi:hypothetical protein